MAASQSPARLSAVSMAERPRHHVTCSDVDFTRQVPAKLSNLVYLDAINAYQNNDATKLTRQIHKVTNSSRILTCCLLLMTIFYLALG
ncbi:hypothetical protein AXF42_Ash015970 [Apostasia shenzhenica]|uniref:Uncharacterized protein n=1 Tax=Apostasia shenzhenica TaxID=1088818 RepID=A0A2I0AWI8_9ASPA|nr:hypothetical protein AXF42_Ash015970 [Apostasia shenzhenica]